MKLICFKFIWNTHVFSQELTRAWGSNERGLNLAEDHNAPGQPPKLCHEVSHSKINLL